MTGPSRGSGRRSKQSPLDDVAHTGGFLEGVLEGSENGEATPAAAEHSQVPHSAGHPARQIQHLRRIAWHIPEQIERRDVAAYRQSHLPRGEPSGD